MTTTTTDPDVDPADTAVDPLHDPKIRERLAVFYIREHRDRRKFGWPSSAPKDREAQLLSIAATWERTRDRIAYLLASAAVRSNGSVDAFGVEMYGREFAAAQAITRSSMDRYLAAYRARATDRVGG